MRTFKEGDKIKSRVSYTTNDEGFTHYYWLTVTDFDTCDIPFKGKVHEYGIVTALNPEGQIEEMFEESVFFCSHC